MTPLDAHAFPPLAFTVLTFERRQGRSVKGANVVRRHRRALGDPLCEEEQSALGLGVGHLQRIYRQRQGGMTCYCHWSAG